MTSVSCIVVTFNKVELLKENIQALINQTVKLQQILIVDNASTDNTEQYIEEIQRVHPVIKYLKLPQNIGGAGGFNAGMKEIYQSDAEFIWIMDDDTIPTPTALEELLETAKIPNLEWGFLSSDVRWIDGEPCKMNIPRTAVTWNEKVDEGLIRILSGTFVSLFMRKEILAEVGLPIKEFFLWSDDIEFTSRISSRYPAYFVSASKVLHKMGANTDTNIFEEEDGNRVARYYFSFRNKLFMEKQKSLSGFLRYFLSLNISVLKVLFTDTKHKWKKIKVIYKGIFAGVFFNPKIEQVKKK